MTTPPLPLAERESQLAEIAAQIAACSACPLHAQGRTRTVPGAGPANAEVMFIGEGPGFNEDKQGLPFIGQSGRLLEEMLGKIGFNRNQVFIGNVVKCRPPENRDPLPIEIDTCTKAYLYKQIAIINPKVIVTLGRFSMGLFFPGAKITQIHGKAKWVDGRAYLPMFHPAAVLRSMETLKPQAEADFRTILTLLDQARGQSDSNAASTANNPIEPDPPPQPPTQSEPPKQLSLF